MGCIPTPSTLCCLINFLSCKKTVEINKLLTVNRRRKNSFPVHHLWRNVIEFRSRYKAGHKRYGSAGKANKISLQVLTIGSLNGANWPKSFFSELTNRKLKRDTQNSLSLRPYQKFILFPMD